MIRTIATLVFLVSLASVLETAAARPPAPAPAAGDVEDRAQSIVQALRKNDPALADRFFFTKEQFPEVKGIKDPGKYFDYLLAVFHKDLSTLRERLTEPDKVEFVRFELGRGRNWVERGKEANKAPYYATYKSRLVLRDAGKEKTFYVRVMISWKGQWYCTHLLRKAMNEKVL